MNNFDDLIQAIDRVGNAAQEAGVSIEELTQLVLNNTPEAVNSILEQRKKDYERTIQIHGR